MAAFNGTTMLLDIDGNTLTLMTNTTLNVNQDLPDSSSKGSSGWAEHINGQRDYSIDLDGVASVADGENFETLLDLILDRSQVSFEFATSTSGDTKVTGTVSLADMSLETPNEDTSTVSGTLTGTGALTKSAVS